MNILIIIQCRYENGKKILKRKIVVHKLLRYGDCINYK